MNSTCLRETIRYYYVQRGFLPIPEDGANPVILGFSLPGIVKVILQHLIARSPRSVIDESLLDPSHHDAIDPGDESIVTIHPMVAPATMMWE